MRKGYLSISSSSKKWELVSQEKVVVASSDNKPTNFFQQRRIIMFGDSNKISITNDPTSSFGGMREFIISDVKKNINTEKDLRLILKKADFGFFIE